MTKLTWAKWLEQVLGILTPVSMGADFNDKEARTCIEDLDTLAGQLEAKADVDEDIGDIDED